MIKRVILFLLLPESLFAGGVSNPGGGAPAATPTPTPLISYRTGDRPTGSRFASAGPRMEVADAIPTDPYFASAQWHVVNNAKGFICFMGDSITLEVAVPETYAAKVYRALNPVTYPLHFANMAVNSGRLSFASDATLDVDMLRKKYISPVFNKLPGVFVLMGGTNDGFIDGQSAATIASRRATIVAGLKASHPLCKIVVVTHLPRQNNGVWETTRQTDNTTIRGLPTNVDYVADWGGDATMASNAAASTNTTYYSDQIHPTDAGQVIGTSYVQPQVNSALAALGL